MKSNCDFVYRDKHERWRYITKAISCSRSITMAIWQSQCINWQRCFVKRNETILSSSCISVIRIRERIIRSTLEEAWLEVKLTMEESRVNVNHIHFVEADCSVNTFSRCICITFRIEFGSSLDHFRNVFSALPPRPLWSWQYVIRLECYSLRLVKAKQVCCCESLVKMPCLRSVMPQSWS